jgi:hypothetical protein
MDECVKGDTYGSGKSEINVQEERITRSSRRENSIDVGNIVGNKK